MSEVAVVDDEQVAAFEDLDADLAHHIQWVEKQYGRLEALSRIEGLKKLLDKLSQG